ncbi:hypothetical protein FKX85_04405 [Echinicola soli]|uniref:Uncharacterized protein n=1 Tax=Echinicola soli TaxID=2591634 RepID=A0A514CEZ1_9BACT|nr:hypothetical protein [Echinicola soli]QDH78320.1 hypothetical protein FKX85_04405 [Echinicola soli]
MNKVLKFYRENLLFLFALIIISVMYLTDLQIIGTYTYYYYPPKVPEPPNYLLSTLIFFRNLSALLMLRYIYKKKENILDVFYRIYSRYDDPTDQSDIVQMMEMNRINKKAGLYIMDKNEKSLFTLSNGFYVPAILQKNYYVDLSQEIEVKPSTLKNSLLGFIFVLISLLVFKMILETDFKTNKDLSAFIGPIILLIIGLYLLIKAFSKKLLFKITKTGILTDNKMYKWSDIQFVFFYEVIGKNSLFRLNIMLHDSDSPVSLLSDLSMINYNKKKLGHILESYHRKYNNK